MTINKIVQEVWKVAPNCKKYEISDKGNVRLSKTKELIIPEPGRKGYLFVASTAVHRMVLLAFHGPKPFPKAECRHLEGNKLNNKSDNLCWGTAKENYEDRIRHGTQLIGATATPKTRAKGAASQIGNKRFLGHTHTEEVRLIISKATREARLGKITPTETRQKISDTMKGKKFSEEHKAKIREAALRRWERSRNNQSCSVG